MDAFYWSRAASRAKQCQAVSLDCAKLNPRGSRARKAWLESARIDAERKRLMRRYHFEHIGQCLGVAA